MPCSDKGGTVKRICSGAKFSQKQKEEGKKQLKIVRFWCSGGECSFLDFVSKFSLHFLKLRRRGIRDVVHCAAVLFYDFFVFCKKNRFLLFVDVCAKENDDNRDRVLQSE